MSLRYRSRAAAARITAPLEHPDAVLTSSAQSASLRAAEKINHPE